MNSHDVILIIITILNLVCFYFISKRIDIVHERIYLICKMNGLMVSDWGKKK